MKRIKVLHILHSIGGVDVYLRLVIENVDANIVESVIMHSEDTNDKEYLDSDGKLVKQYFAPIKREIHLIKDIISIYKTIKLFKKEKPNLVHAHSAKGGIIARLASLFYNVNVLHTPHAYSYLSASSSIKRNFFLKIEKVFKNFNSFLLATSESERIRGIEEVGYVPSKALLFNNSVLPINNIDENNVVKRYNLPKQYICTVGRPSYQKNIELMIESIKEVKKKIPNIHLVLMGVGVYCPSKENVEKLIKINNLQENITMIEWIEREHIFSIIDKSMFYISTSRYEGLPYSMIESLALSKACVATYCDGNKDLVKNEYNGYLVENNIELISEKIFKLYSNEKLRNKFGKNSFNLFQEKFNLKTNIKSLESIYLKYSTDRKL